MRCASLFLYNAKIRVPVLRLCGSPVSFTTDPSGPFPSFQPSSDIFLDPGKVLSSSLFMIPDEPSFSHMQDAVRCIRASSVCLIFPTKFCSFTLSRRPRGLYYKHLSFCSLILYHDLCQSHVNRQDRLEYRQVALPGCLDETNRAKGAHDHSPLSPAAAPE